TLNLRLERHLDALRALPRLAMEHGLDVVAVGVEEEGGVVAGVVVALARRAVVAAAGLEPRSMPGLDHGAVAGLEGEMVATGQLARRRLAVGGRDEQLVDPEMVVALAAEGQLQNLEQGLVEAAAGLDVAHDQLDMVDQAAAMQGLDFHRRLPASAVERTRQPGVPPCLGAGGAPIQSPPEPR